MNIELQKLFSKPVKIEGNLIILDEDKKLLVQNQTQGIFSEKWLKNSIGATIGAIERFQLEWYLKLYGFECEDELQDFLKGRKIIFDAGCGLGYKAAWFANMAPDSVVLGMDYSDAVYEASGYYKHIENLYFIRGDISETNIISGSLDFISCDQVIHHTENPEKTFSHLSNLLKNNGEFACYVYAKKALPRELLDDYFRTYTLKCSREQLWEFSEQITRLGKTLSELNINLNVPDIPLLGIKGGDYSIQRFIYWNFIKCFWNEQFGWDSSVLTNFDWYSPSKAARYSEEEFRQWIDNNLLEIQYFHKEKACYSGRFLKNKKLQIC